MNTFTSLLPQEYQSATDTLQTVGGINLYIEYLRYLKWLQDPSSQHPYQLNHHALIGRYLNLTNDLPQNQQSLFHQKALEKIEAFQKVCLRFEFLEHKTFLHDVYTFTLTLIAMIHRAEDKGEEIDDLKPLDIFHFVKEIPLGLVIHTTKQEGPFIDINLKCRRPLDPVKEVPMVFIIFSLMSYYFEAYHFKMNKLTLTLTEEIKSQSKLTERDLIQYQSQLTDLKSLTKDI